MKALRKKIVCCVMLTCYGTGTTTHAVTLLNELLNTGVTQSQVTPEKKTRPIADGQIWTAKTHTLSVFHSELSTHLFSSDAVFWYSTSSGIYVSTDFQSRYTHLECLPSKPRDPPLI